MGLFVLAYAVFSPVLEGGFLFDDHANLSALGKYGAVDSWSSFLRYVTSGIADPLGRPVSLVSFLLDARTWPAEAGPFLRTNVFLHLLNGVLLATLIHQLSCRATSDQKNATTIAILGAAIWMLHPLWVSTVGYVVQRQAMLSATFVLLGVLSWLRSISHFEEDRPTHAWMWAIGAIVGCGGLAALSKANGALLPVIILALEWTVLKPSVWRGEGAQTNHRAKARLLLLTIPALTLMGMALLSVTPQPEGRPWSTFERAITQPRVILDYLSLISLPRVDSPGVFSDGLAVSTGLFRPRSTFFSLLAVGAILTSAVLLRKRYPIAAASIAFYFTAQLMESTIIPLELYFEHRNYLPAMLFGWPIARWIVQSSNGILLRALFTSALVATLAGLSYSRSTLWANQDLQAAQWSATEPGSPRAQTWYGQRLLAAGGVNEARRVFTNAILNQGDNAMLLLNMANTYCGTGAIEPTLKARILSAVSEPNANKDITYGWIRRHTVIDQGYCPELTTSFLQEAISALRAGSGNTAISVARENRLRAYVYLTEGKCTGANNAFVTALRSLPEQSDRYSDAATLASHCGPLAGLMLLNATDDLNWGTSSRRLAMPRIHASVVAAQSYWEEEIDRLRQVLEADLQRPDREVN